MCVAVNKRLYEYEHEQVKLSKEKFYWKQICKQKVKKKGGGRNSVLRAPVLKSEFRTK